MSRLSILVVDDERTLARSIQAFLSEAGHEVAVAESGERGLELLEGLRPDVVFLDVSLPGIGGLEVLARIREFDARTPVVVMTAYGSIEGAVEAVKRGAFDYLKKPVDLDELQLLAERAWESSRLQGEVAYYREREARGVALDGVLGDSPAMRAVLERVAQVAALDETPPILLTGETGTGKGLVAHAIHARSRHAAGPFIEVNCTAIPGQLMEAEIFGYERGAFTDAKESKMGLFEAAEGGFLFLDEIGDLEPALQGKLLRAIEERTVRRVGGLRDRRVDVRILAATNRDLLKEGERGRFRKDLYYRLAVILLHLPPLRERSDDVLLLARHFLRAFRSKYGRSVQRIGSAAEDLLRAYRWPGNVRELSHVIERAVLWSRGTTLEPEQLALEMRSREAPAGPRPGDSAVPADALPPEGIDLATWERSLIERALRDAGGNQTRAARLLGVTRDTLRYRLKKFGLGSAD
ncbi:MAG: sigma-54-dependent transcriptional regulator [Gemmatimonadota bacterium]